MKKTNMKKKPTAMKKKFKGFSKLPEAVQRKMNKKLAKKVSKKHSYKKTSSKKKKLKK